MWTLSGMSDGSSFASVLTAAGVAVEADDAVDAAAVGDVVDAVVDAVVVVIGDGGVAAGGVISSTTGAADVVVVVSGVVGLTSSVIETVAVAARLNFLSLPPLACFHSFKILLSKSTNSALILPVALLVLGTLHTSSLQSASTGVLLNPSNAAELVRVAMVDCIMCSNATTMRIW